METTFRVSVRELVGFSYFPPDITPGGSTADMLAGTQAHMARESAQAAEFETEKPVRADIGLAKECVTVFGRMDAFCDGTPPVIEEIKLCREPPAEPLPEHVAQARLYGALLMYGTPYDAAELRVVYVNLLGEPLKVFAEVLQRDALLAFLMNLLRPWLAFAVSERERALRRDESLKALAFPFANYRAGQRELAVQVYTAITRKKRLFASLPTGTGKSAAVLFPALKALGEGKTRKVVYLTARTTARQSPLNALERMCAGGAKLRVSTLTAKEKLCPAPTRCHPDDCPRAKGHYLRQGEAVQKMFTLDGMWTDERIVAVADTFMLCPFEFALRLTELADVVLMDVNYAFDPFAQVIRIFKRRKDFTLLVDEAHHLLDRVRESLSGSLDTRELKRYRVDFGKALGRRHPYYRQLSALIAALCATQPDGVTVTGENEPTVPDTFATGVTSAAREPRETQPLATVDEVSLSATHCATARNTGKDADAIAAQTADMPECAQQPASNATQTGEPAQPRETRLTTLPDDVVLVAKTLCDATLTLLQSHLPTPESRADASALLRRLAPFLYAAGRFDERYAVLLECHGRERLLELYCLSPAETIAAVTKGLKGTVFFSATLSPLEAMRELLGGTEDDACFALPSPFPPQRLAVVRKRVQTRYAFRGQSAGQVAASIAQAVNARLGKYIAYFPSYAYLRLVQAELETLAVPPLLVQDREMDEETRAAFLEAFTVDESPKLGLCVLGGLFSEGVDLPGEQLIGAIIVGVGLPTPSLRLKTLQDYYQARFGDGFLYAWMIPAMQKVSQAGGRVIRTELDRGMVLLLDDRYYDARYTRLLPPDWRLGDGDILGAARNLDRLEEP